MNKPSVTILMSTYNGEKYIQQQLDSILAQEEVELNIVIRDDCSTDKTISIIKTYKKINDNIKLIEGKKNIGACQSFFSIMKEIYSTDYYALADQDDIWDKDKLITAIRMLEKTDSTLPNMYYSNLRIMTADGHCNRLSHLKPHYSKNKMSYVSEVLATGCTVVYNKSMARVCKLHLPVMFSMHDSWVYCVAKEFGQVIYDFDPHIYYRIHSNNAIGTSLQKRSIIQFLVTAIKRMKYSSEPRFMNACTILKEFQNELPGKDREIIRSVVGYKDSLKNTIRLLFIPSIMPDDLWRRMLFKILVLRRRI